jgi:hypothetical protein
MNANANDVRMSQLMTLLELRSARGNGLLRNSADTKANSLALSRPKGGKTCGLESRRTHPSCAMDRGRARGLCTRPRDIWFNDQISGPGRPMLWSPHRADTVPTQLRTYGDDDQMPDDDAISEEETNGETEPSSANPSSRRAPPMPPDELHRDVPAHDLAQRILAAFEKSSPADRQGPIAEVAGVVRQRVSQETLARFFGICGGELHSLVPN